MSDKEFYCPLCRDSGFELIDSSDEEFEMQVGTAQLKRMREIYGGLGGDPYYHASPYAITCRKCNGESKKKRDAEFMERKARQEAKKSK